jgi:hypothetical protein
MFDPQASGEEFRRRNPALQGKFLALYAGAHGMSNDLGVVLQAAKLLAGQAEIAFVFLGDGKDKPALQAQAKQMKLENVFSCRLCPNRNVPGAGRRRGLYCYPQAYPALRYGYPNKVFDYMAAAAGGAGYSGNP